jgi:hypothetical protein
MTTWGAFADAERELAAFAAERLRAAPSYPVAVPATVVAAASYAPADGYVPFELRPTEVRCDGYGDVTLPEHRRWRG